MLLCFLWGDSMAEIHTHVQSLPVKYSTAIGRVAFQWNRVELHLQTFVWHFMNLDWKQGRVLTFDKESFQKIEMFDALSVGWNLDSASKKEIRSISNRATLLNKRRNRIVHGIWGQTKRSKDRRMFYITKLKQRVLPEVKTHDAHWLDQVASDIKALDDRLLKLHDHFDVPVP